MAKKFKTVEIIFKDNKKGPDKLRPKNKHKRASYKKYRGQGR